MKAIYTGEISTATMAGLQRNAGPCLAGVFQPIQRKHQGANARSKDSSDGLENVPDIQMATAVPPNTL